MTSRLRTFGLRWCVAAVAVCWAPCWLFLAIVFGMLSELPVAGFASLAIAVLGTLHLCNLCARVLNRSRARWWLPITASFGAPSLVLAYALLWCLGLVNYRLTGPTSSSGFTPIIDVRDAHPGWSADFYSDVHVLDARGNVVAEWKDHGGQYPSDGPRLLRDSMRWTSPTTLEFTTRFAGAASLTVR